MTKGNRRWNFPNMLSMRCASVRGELPGPIQGVERMLVEGRECRGVVAQLSAATKGLEQVRFKLVVYGLVHCLETPSSPIRTAMRSKKSNACSWSWRGEERACVER